MLDNTCRGIVLSGGRRGGEARQVKLWVFFKVGKKTQGTLKDNQHHSIPLSVVWVKTQGLARVSLDFFHSVLHRCLGRSMELIYHTEELEKEMIFGLLLELFALCNFLRAICK